MVTAAISHHHSLLGVASHCVKPGLEHIGICIVLGMFATAWLHNNLVRLLERSNIFGDVIFCNAFLLSTEQLGWNTMILLVTEATRNATL